MSSQTPGIVLLRSLLLAVSGALAAAARTRRAVLSALAIPFALFATGAMPVASDVSLGRLFLVFLKAGSVVFGSGYVLLAFLRGDLVEHLRRRTHDSPAENGHSSGTKTPRLRRSVSASC